MTRIDFINQLYGDDAPKRAQRTKARFINTTMKVTLLEPPPVMRWSLGRSCVGLAGNTTLWRWPMPRPPTRMVALPSR